jgi:hypothetical protein
VHRADEPRDSLCADADNGAVLGSDVLVMMASAGARLKEVMARVADPAADEVAEPAAPLRPAGAPSVLAPLARARDGFLVAPGWGRRAPPPIR